MAFTFNVKTQSSLFTATTSNLPINCGTGTKLLVVTVTTADTASRTGGTITYNNVNMTQAGTTQSGSAECTSELWYLYNPATGSLLNVTIPNSGAQSIRAQAASFIGATGAVLEQTIQAGTSASQPSLALNSVSNGALVVNSLGSGYKDTFTTASNITIYTTDEGAWQSNAQYHLMTATGNQTMSYTFAGSDDVAFVMASFDDAIPPTGSAITTRFIMVN